MLATPRSSFKYLIKNLRQHLDGRLAQTDLFDYPSVSQLAAHLAAQGQRIVVELQGPTFTGQPRQLPFLEGSPDPLFGQLIENAHREVPGGEKLQAGWDSAVAADAGGVQQADEPSPQSSLGGLRISPVSVSKPMLWM